MARHMLPMVMLLLLLSCRQGTQKVFDAHLHGEADVPAQLAGLVRVGVYRAAVSTSWAQQDRYRRTTQLDLLFGLMFPCPNGRVPYSLQPCFSDGKDWPTVDWVAEQIEAGQIDFLGEILSQYYGISPSDSLMMPYYALAQQYHIPVGIHTGSAGPGHGAPNFSEALGTPSHLEALLSKFPGLKVWIMHAGDGYYLDAIAIMERHGQVYADISVLTNPTIVSPGRFATIMRAFVASGLEDRLMFGTDNGDVRQAIAAVEGLSFLSSHQKKDIYYRNAERFFAKSTTLR